MIEHTKTALLRDIEVTFIDEGDGPTVLLLHGYPFDRSMWAPQIDALKRNGFRAIAPDLRGLGAAAAPTSVGGSTSEDHRLKSVALNTMDEMARDAAALLDQLQVKDTVVCGLSMGGYVAFEFRKLFPARVRALILAGTRAPADNEKEKQVRFEQAERMLVEGMAPIAEATLPKLLAARTLKAKPDVVDSVREMILKTNPSGAAAVQRGMAARRDYSEDLAEINVPALIVVGREDSIRPVADAEFMQRGIQNTQLEIIEDAAHMTNMEQPEGFNRIVIRFLERAQ